MTINKQQNGGALVIRPEGRLDTMTAPALEAEIKGALDGVTDLTFDFEKLEYVSSAGLRVLFSAYRAMRGQGTMKIVNANEIITEVFDVTGFADVLRTN